MTIKILAFDTETTGLDPSVHEIIQLSGCIIVDFQIREWFDLRARPDRPEMAEMAALAIHGFQLRDLDKFPGRRGMYSTLLGILERHCNKFDPKDKYYSLGYNVDFDINMLSSLFRDMGDKYLGSWLNWRKLDVMGLAAWESLSGHYDELPNFRLATLAEHHGIEIQAHDSLSDIAATVKLAHELYRGFTGNLEPENVIRNYEYQPELPA